MRYPLEIPRMTPIRRIQVVVDVEDPMVPALPLPDFIKAFGKEPEPPRYRVLTIEVLVCPEDGNVVLASECAECPRFLRRSGDYIICVPSRVSSP
ncbi:hypothetical protein B6U66_00030 [Candidatus Bathyarchaeota archaeon ex4484_135]|nr:MAG: hypothetical protein B6U66_00030 [Candidatus Bathyarchaeota archaeon ex4484_135]